MVRTGAPRVAFADDVGAAPPAATAPTKAEDEAPRAASSARPSDVGDEMQRVAAAMCQQLQVLLAMARTIPHEQRVAPPRVGPQQLPVVGRAPGGVAVGGSANSSPTRGTAAVALTSPMRENSGGQRAAGLLRLRFPKTSIGPAVDAARALLTPHQPANSVTSPVLSTSGTDAARGISAATAHNVRGGASRHHPPVVPALRFTKDALNRESSSGDDGGHYDDDDHDEQTAAGCGRFRREDGARRAPGTPVASAHAVTPRWTKSTRVEPAAAASALTPSASRTVASSEPPPNLTVAAADCLSPAAAAQRPASRHHHQPATSAARSTRSKADFPAFDFRGRRLLWPVEGIKAYCRRSETSASARTSGSDPVEPHQFDCLPPTTS